MDRAMDRANVAVDRIGFIVLFLLWTWWYTLMDCKAFWARPKSGFRTSGTGFRPITITRNDLGQGMPTLPIPVFVACVLGFASLRLWRQLGRASPLVWLLALCALQSVIIALSQHYGLAFARVLQPLAASLIPPGAWLAYRGRVGREDIVHGLGPLTGFAALLVTPPFLDVVLPGLFVMYGVMILISLRSGEDAQPDMLLASGDLPAMIWRVIGVALISSAFSDVLIVGTQLAGYPQLKPWIITIFSLGNLMIIGGLGLSPHLQTVEDDVPEVNVSAAQASDPALWGDIQAFMAAQKPYLDPDLTLSRLSRKMGVPVKVLSATVNLTTGENVSRFINAARIAAAQEAMLAGETVTNAMLMSGFNTKSNFNREFLRVSGRSPTAWLSHERARQQTAG